MENCIQPTIKDMVLNSPQFVSLNILYNQIQPLIEIGVHAPTCSDPAFSIKSCLGETHALPSFYEPNQGENFQDKSSMLKQ